MTSQIVITLAADRRTDHLVWLAYTRALEAENARLREYLSGAGLLVAYDAMVEVGGGVTVDGELVTEDGGLDASGPSQAVTDARGLFAWQPGDEPAEASVRRMRDTPSVDPLGDGPSGTLNLATGEFRPFHPTEPDEGEATE